MDIAESLRPCSKKNIEFGFFNGKMEMDNMMQSSQGMTHEKIPAQETASQEREDTTTTGINETAEHARAAMKAEAAAEILYASILREAKILFATQLDWSDYFRQILGLHGLVQNSFRLPEELNDFERSKEYAEIQRMLASLRTRTTETPGEPTKVITVRLPKSVHESLRAEAFSRRTSMNKLCISKLMQYIDDALIPEEV